MFDLHLFPRRWGDGRLGTKNFSWCLAQRLPCWRQHVETHAIHHHPSNWRYSKKKNPSKCRWWSLHHWHKRTHPWKKENLSPWFESDHPAPRLAPHPPTQGFVFWLQNLPKRDERGNGVLQVNLYSSYCCIVNCNIHIGRVRVGYWKKKSSSGQLWYGVFKYSIVYLQVSYCRVFPVIVSGSVPVSFTICNLN